MDLSVLGRFISFTSAHHSPTIESTIKSLHRVKDDSVASFQSYELLENPLSEEEEELGLKKQKIVWSREGQVLKQFTMGESVFQMFLCQFEMNQKPCLCVQLERSIMIFGHDGKEYSVPLFYKVRKCWVLPKKIGGFLIEYETCDDVCENNNNDGNNINIDGPTQNKWSISNKSSFYSLSHPLEELREVKLNNSHCNPISSPFSDENTNFCNEEIIHLDKTYPIVVTYDDTRNIHLIYHIGKNSNGTIVFYPSLQEDVKTENGIRAPCALKAYIYNDLDDKRDLKSDVVALFKKQTSTLYGYRLKKVNTFWTYSYLFSIQNVSAAETITLNNPIFLHASNEKNDNSKYLIVLDSRNHNLGAYIGSYCIAEYNLLNVYSSILQPSNCGEMPSHIVEIRDVVGSKVNIVLNCGKVFRIKFSTFQNEHSEIISDCFKVLQTVMPASLMTSFHYDFVKQCQNDSNGDTSPWTIFCGLFQYLIMGFQKIEHDNGVSNDHWQLLQLEHRESNLFESKTLTIQNSSCDFNSFKKVRPNMTYALHLLYENYKLDILKGESRRALAHLLYRVCYFMGWISFVEHYLKDFPDHNFTKTSTTEKVQCETTSILYTEEWKQNEEAPNIYKWICTRMNHRSKSLLYPLIAHCPVLECSRKICRLIYILTSTTSQRDPYRSSLSKVNHYPVKQPFEQLVSAMMDEGLMTENLDILPFGLSIMFQEALEQCKQIQSVDGYPCDSQKKSGIEKIVPSNNSDNSSQFPNDNRLEEVFIMLDSSKPTRVNKEKEELIETDSQQHPFLSQLASRILSLPIGKGMYSLQTKEWASSSTDTIKITPIVLACEAKQSRNSYSTIEIQIPSSEQAPDATPGKNEMPWADFHNGAATSLCLEADHSITREWITYHKPKIKASSDHGGFLLGLGLHGHLKSLGRTDIYSYLSARHDPTTVGILLGLSCTKRGTQDQGLTKTLSLHIPTLVVGADLEVSMEVQTAALLGLGLVYQETTNRFITEVLMGELTRTPDDNMICNLREGHALAAGLGIGLVNLAQGGSPKMNALADLRVEEKLIRYMIGGARPASDPLLLRKHYLEENEITMSNIQSSSLKHKIAQCNKIQESEKFVNVDVTGPGSCMALTLMYLQSNHQGLANQMKIPSNSYELEYVRPYMALLRTIGSAIIMWDTITPTYKWVRSYIPEVIIRQKNLDQTRELNQIIMAYIIAGCCMSIGIKYAGTGSKEVYALILGHMNLFISNTLKKCPSQLTKLQHQLRSLDRQICNHCGLICFLSACCVMSGKGMIHPVQIIRKLRKKYEGDFGAQLVLSMGLGLTFLGSCKYSLSTATPASIAYLLISLYPIFPQNSNDNKYHLQPLRHFYVLAASKNPTSSNGYGTEGKGQDSFIGSNHLHLFSLLFPKYKKESQEALENDFETIPYHCRKIENAILHVDTTYNMWNLMLLLDYYNLKVVRGLMDTSVPSGKKMIFQEHYIATIKSRIEHSLNKDGVHAVLKEMIENEMKGTGNKPTENDTLGQRLVFSLCTYYNLPSPRILARNLHTMVVKSVAKKKNISIDELMPLISLQFPHIPLNLARQISEIAVKIKVEI